MTNEQLIRQYYDGDEAALEKLYHKNLGLIRGIAKEAAAEFNCLIMEQHHPNQCSAYTKTILDDLCGEVVPEGYDGDPYEWLMPGTLTASAEQAVYRKVCIELLRELFDILPKKDRDILGKTCGVFGYPEATLKEIGMYHMMKESAVEKAKNRAVEKLREAYPGSRLQVWRAVHRMMRRPVPPPGEDSELRRNFPQYVRALAEVYGVLNEL